VRSVASQSGILICVATQVRNLSDDQVAWAADTFKLLADPTRIRIIWALLHGEHSVNELAEHVGARPAAVSQHLAKLRLTRLVSTRREGTTIYYRAHNEHVRRLTEEALVHADQVIGDAPGHGAHRRARSIERIS
jgi:DNA-binding transcriptional ArsR family regulator